MLDFSNAEPQKEFATGPVPSGSIVIVEMQVLEPSQERQDYSNPLISVAKSGLKQIYCQFTVAKGEYQGVTFRQNITLPLDAQTITLTDKQVQACKIGASMLRAICESAQRAPRINNVSELSGLRYPVRVKINPKEKEGSDGRVFWNNEIAFVITPKQDEYNLVRQYGEIINPNGAVTSPKPETKTTEASHQQKTAFSNDECPF